LPHPSAPEDITVRRFAAAFGIYIAVVFIGGALLAPAIYVLLRDSAALFPAVADQPFHRYVNRSLLFLAIAGLWPFLRALGLRSLKDLGLVGPRGQWQKFAFAFLLSFTLLALISGIGLAAGARQLSEPIALSSIAGRLGAAVLTALIVATIEEILFRGGLFGALRRAMPWAPALVLVSAVFAFLHFLKQTRHVGPVTWDSGLAILPQMLSGLIEFHNIPMLFGLFLSGMLFGIGYQRTGNLYFPIGLHAGAIVVLKLNLAFTMPAAETSFWGTGMLIDGWFAVGALLLAAATLASAPLPFGRPSANRGLQPT
jgi:membrane protease YdiL (CAAX protease family)